PSPPRRREQAKARRRGVPDALRDTRRGKGYVEEPQRRLAKRIRRRATGGVLGFALSACGGGVGTSASGVSGSVGCWGVIAHRTRVRQCKHCGSRCKRSG